MDASRNDVARLAFSATAQRISPEQRRRFESHLEEILRALGLPLEAETARTPARLLQAWIDATAGYDRDPKLVTLFPAAQRNSSAAAQIVEGPIAFNSLCEHHALPFIGHAWVGYVASDTLIGISKLTRIVHQYACRFTMQERLGHDVASELASIVQAQGTAVRIVATHACTRMRGVREASAHTTTTMWIGSFEQSESLRHEFLELCSDR